MEREQKPAHMLVLGKRMNGTETKCIVRTNMWTGTTSGKKLGEKFRYTFGLN